LPITFNTEAILDSSTPDMVSPTHNLSGAQSGANGAQGAR